MGYRDEQRRTYEREWKRRRRQQDKQRAVEMFGGKCQRCGYCENIAALQFDHVVPLKRKTVSERRYPNTATLVVQGRINLSGLQLLCANCHAIKTYEEDRKQYDHFVTGTLTG